MKKWMILTAMGAVFAWGVDQAQAAEGAHRIGGGANYWVTTDKIDVDNVEEDGFSYYASYQYQPGLLGLEFDFEMLPDMFGDDAYAPQAYVLLGESLYAALGVGMLNVNDSFADDPFYAIRAGFNLEVLPHINLDIYANYRFISGVELDDVVDPDNDDGVKNIDGDTLFLGAALRIGL
jgi:hypothetical protein